MIKASNIVPVAMCVSVVMYSLYFVACQGRGGSFKMSFQVANTGHPHSTFNTVVFCAFEASDTASNLLDCYSQHLRNLEWE